MSDASLGGGLGVVFDRDADRAWYWTMLARSAHPLIHLCEPAAAIPRQGLLVRAEGLWAEHVCEAPYEQWTVANEVYGVELDDPDDAVTHERGVVVPLAFDLEWYATGSSIGVDDGYGQTGEVHGVLNVGEDVITLAGAPAWRTHRWNVDDPIIASSDEAGDAQDVGDGLRAPIRLPSGVYDRQLAVSGWRWQRRAGDARTR
ncbi:MAG: hypothetical protein AB7L13_03780 [Acidimicrobiia bacterium]